MKTCPGENEANSELNHLLKIVHCSLSFLWAPFRVLERMSHRTDSNASLSNSAHLLSPQHLEMWIWIGYKCCKSYEWLSLNSFLILRILETNVLMSQSCALTLLLDRYCHFPCVQISSISSLLYCNIHILITTSNNFRGNQIDNILINQRNE